MLMLVLPIESSLCKQINMLKAEPDEIEVRSTSAKSDICWVKPPPDFLSLAVISAVYTVPYGVGSSLNTAPRCGCTGSISCQGEASALQHFSLERHAPPFPLCPQ